MCARIRHSDRGLLDMDPPITAIVYSDGPRFEAFLREATTAMAADGLRLAGLVHRNQPRPDRLRCDMYLEDLATGSLHRISDDRGRHARGCILNLERLLRACEVAEAALSEQSDVLVLCKYGKAEMAGGGFRSLIVKAIEISVPVLIGVPSVNLDAFHDFAAGMAHEIELSQLTATPRFGFDPSAIPPPSGRRIDDRDIAGSSTGSWRADGKPVLVK